MRLTLDIHTCIICYTYNTKPTYKHVIFLGLYFFTFGHASLKYIYVFKNTLNAWYVGQNVGNI